jgi:hypothetical protein
MGHRLDQDTPGWDGGLAACLLGMHDNAHEMRLMMDDVISVKNKIT